MMSKRIIFFIGIVAILSFTNLLVHAQGIISYGFKYHGKEVREDHPLLLSFKEGIAVLHSGNEKEQRFIDYNKKAVFKTLDVHDHKYTTKTPFDSLIKATLLKDTATILGYLCHKAHLTIRSNSIDVWYTDALSLKGTPDLEIAPYLGLVLKVVRNGNFEMFAKNIELGAIPDSLKAAPVMGKVVDEATFRALQIKSRYTSIPVFTDQQINFGDSILNPNNRQLNKVYRFSGGTVIAKKIHLPQNFHGNVFATVTQYSNGDAYDRTGCVFVIPMKDSITFLDALENGIDVLPVYNDNEGNKYQGIVKTDNYKPPVELMRFFTPFGVGAYNSKRKIKGYDWADSVTYTQDVTALLPLLQGDTWIGVYIGNYDKNGHTVSLKLNYYPGERDTSVRRFVLPLFNALNIMEMSGQNYGRLFNNDSLKLRVFVPDSISDLRLRYISTGHGGWGGGDEFNPKVNTLFIDGKKVFSYTPWRTDCATYRLKNPSSGNFRNGLSSSDLSRSGWCPGTTTNPVFIPLPRLKPGWHTFTVAIPQGEQEGNSFSFWNVSGCLMGRVIPQSHEGH